MSVVSRDISQPKTTERKFSAHFLGFILGCIVILMILAAIYLKKGYNLVAVTILMSAFFGVLGIHQNNRILGILINERNLMSLSRFQSVIWTILILSGYLTIAFERICAGDVPDPLAIGIDWRIWTLMGISTASLIGTPLILSNKKLKNPDHTSLTQILGSDVTQRSPSEGILYMNPSSADADFTDMFEGDELRDTNFIDIAKVQMFFFTIIAAITYEALLIQTIQTTLPHAIERLPELSEGFLAILGISHASYLTSKSLNNTPVVG